MRKFIGLILLILGTTVAVHGWQSSYKVVIPKVLTYPTTTLAFSSKSISAGSQIKAPDGIRVKFDDPSWAASVSAANWVTTGGGTFFKLTCKPSSTSCIQATKGSGTYAYALTPTKDPAPKTYGSHSLAWDVTPPGDLVLDLSVAVPEIDPASGAAALALIAGAMLVLRGRRKK